MNNSVNSSRDGQAEWVWLDEVALMPPSTWLFFEVCKKEYKEGSHYVIPNYVKFDPDTVKEMG